jgi:hypothetical protein
MLFDIILVLTGKKMETTGKAKLIAGANLRTANMLAMTINLVIKD